MVTDVTYNAASTDFWGNLDATPVGIVADVRHRRRREGTADADQRHLARLAVAAGFGIMVSAACVAPAAPRRAVLDGVDLRGRRVAAGPAAVAPTDGPVFRSGVELVAIDVQVVDRDGRPTVSLEADQFDVSIDGRKRKVLSADFVRYSESPPGRLRQTFTPSLTREGAPTDRVFILAVDQLSFRPGAARAAAENSAHPTACRPTTSWGPYLSAPRLGLTH
jgi:hypothetical protein